MIYLYVLLDKKKLNCLFCDRLIIYLKYKNYFWISYCLNIKVMWLFIFVFYFIYIYLVYML